MAKRHSNKSSRRMDSARRVVNNANPYSYPLPRRFVLPLSLSTIQDNRRYHPHGISRSFRALDGRRVRPRFHIKPVRYSAPTIRRPFPILADLRDTRVLPRDAVICARRRVRKEVLHALGRTGRGGQRRPRFNENSNVRCS